MSCIEKRRKCFLWFPIRTSKYELVKNFSDELELVVTTGILMKRIEKIKLFKITDISYQRSFGNLLCGVGTLTIHSSDASSSAQLIPKIRKPKQFMEMLERCIANERKRMKVGYTETNVVAK